MIAIVGGGPAGLLCAKEAAFNGKSVTVFEEHGRIGEPTHCAGLVSKKGLDELGVDYERAVLNECSGARIFSPGKMIEVRRKDAQACVIDRPLFDRTIAEEAASAGARIVTGKRVKSRAGDVLVGADGANSLVAKTLGNKRELVKAYQVVAKLEREPEFVELHFGPWSRGFFAWIIPQGDSRCRIGVGVKDGSPQKALGEFLKARGMKIKPESVGGGVIPVFNGNPTVFPERRTILVGDAADQVKASSGGGIAIGGFCARIAGEVLGRELPLIEYEKHWHREFKRELVLHRRIHDFFYDLAWKEMDELFELANQEGVPELIEKYGDMDRPSKLFKQLIGKPRLVATCTRYFARIAF